MNWVDLGLQVAIAAAVGLVTNFLAVASIFRPHEPRRLFWLIPYQGVVPKRIDALADGIGKLVEDDLLTDSVIEDILLSEDTIQFLESLLVDGVISALQQDDRTLKQGLEELFHLAPEVLERNVPAWLHKHAMTLLHREDVADRLARWTGEQFQQLLDTPIAAVTASEHYLTVRYGIREALRGIIESGRLKGQLTDAIVDAFVKYKDSDTPLGEVVPKKVQTQIRRWLLGEGPFLVDRFVEWLQSEDVSDKLQDIIDSIIAGFPKIGQWVAKRFDKKHDLAGQIIYHVTSFLESPENQKQLLNSFSGYLDDIWALSGSQISKRFDVDDVRGTVDDILGRIISMRNADALMDRADTWLRSAHGRTWRELVSLRGEGGVVEMAEDEAAAASEDGNDLAPPERIPRVLVSSLLRSGALERAVAGLIADQWERLMAMQPADVAHRVRVVDVDRAKTRLRSAYEGLVRKYAGAATQRLPLRKHVAAHVRQLPIAKVEESLKELLDRELKTITWMGLVLGALVGLFGYFIRFGLGFL